MNAVIWIFVAIAFGLMLFVSIQEDLPPELAFLRAEPGTVPAPDELPNVLPKGASAPHTFTYEGWTVRQTGTTIELVKPLEGRMEVNGNVFDLPELGVLCHLGELDLRIDSRLPTTGTQTTPVQFQGVASTWSKGVGRSIFPARPTDVVGAMLNNERPLEVVLSFVDLGKQKLTFNPKGLAALYKQFPPGCQ